MGKWKVDGWPWQIRERSQKWHFELQAWDLNSHFAGKTSQTGRAGSILRDLSWKAMGRSWTDLPPVAHSSKGIMDLLLNRKESGNLSYIPASTTNSWSWTNHLTFLDLSFLISKISSEDYWALTSFSILTFCNAISGDEYNWSFLHNNPGIPFSLPSDLGLHRAIKSMTPSTY